jgi:HEAT repeat protein
MELGRMRSAEAAAVLAEAMNDPDPDIRAEAIRGLGLHRAGAYVEAIITHLKTGARQVRIAAIDTLWRIGDKRAVGHLIDAIDDPDAEIRYQAIFALNMMGTADAGPGMIRRLADDAALPETAIYRRVCDAAAAYLECIRTPDAMAAVAAWRRGRSGGQTGT